MLEKSGSAYALPWRRERVQVSMPLIMATPGQEARISRITGNADVRRRLAELGFVVGGDVSVVNEIAGNLIVQVKDGRIALDHGMATRIFVD